MSPADGGPGAPPADSRLTKAYRTVALILLNTVLLFGFAECASMVSLKVLDMRTQDSDVHPYYTAQEWSESYWRDHRLQREVRHRVYEPYVIWTMRPFEGETVRVEEDGRRPTPGASCVPNAYRVFAMGGSTMFGVCAPNWGTIPAYLQSTLAAGRAGPVCVQNFGQGGWVSTQNMIELILQLQKGNVPDLVIFYDGINDAFSAYQGGVAGTHQNVDEVGAKFNGDYASLIVKKTHFFQMVVRLVQRFTGEQIRRTGPVDAEGLADGVVETYLGNVAVVRALGRAYGFPTYFFWQPVISVGEKSLAPVEKVIRRRMDPGEADTFDQVWARIKPQSERDPDFFYIADVLGDRSDPVYCDLYHLTPVGNELVAERMGS